MAQIIVPGVPKMIEVTILLGETTGTAYHYMGTIPQCAAPNPDVEDGARARASADETTLTVTTDVPVSQNIRYKVMVMI